jgi:hypothetical protein
LAAETRGIRSSMPQSRAEGETGRKGEAEEDRPRAS